MDKYAFQEGVKVQRFFLTLIGEARLWHELLRPINVDWIRFQNQKWLVTLCHNATSSMGGETEHYESFLANLKISQ